ncbi:MAG: MFS transporter permease [Methylotenera sp.]|nr:MFS transporter permease [Methylotenera sp.]
MTNNANQQINAIHNMLSNGHRNLRMEAHSLWLWGLSGGLLLAISDHILTASQIPDLHLRPFAWLALLIVVFGGVAIADWRLTKKVKATRDESWSFIHRQIIKVWWLLISIGVLLTFAIFFFGGGYMIYSAWIILVGLGLFIHGLFSDEMLEWAGGALLIIGILCLSFKLPYQSMKWIAASIFAVGLPLLAIIINQQKIAWQKLACLLAWLLVTILPPILTLRLISNTAPDVPVISLAQFKAQQSVVKTQIVTIPENTLIPVNIQLTGDLFKNNPNLILPLQLNKTIEMVMVDGKPTRQVRFAGDSWRHANEAGWVHIPWIKAEMTPSATPEITTSLIVNLQEK